MSSETQRHLKITDLVPGEYEDFFAYCRLAGKNYADEITSIDYVAYRSQCGRDKSEVKKLRAIIETGEVLSKPEATAEEPSDSIFASRGKQVEKEASEETKVDHALGKASREAEEDKSSPNAIEAHFKFQCNKDLEKTYAELLKIDANQFADKKIGKKIPLSYLNDLSVRAQHGIIRSGCNTLRDLYLMTPAELAGQVNLGKKSVNEIESELVRIARSVLPLTQSESEGSEAISNKPVLDKTEHKSTVISEEVMSAIWAILRDEPYTLEDLSENAKRLCLKVIEAVEVLGKEICIELMNCDRRPYFGAVIESLQDFYHESEKSREILENAKLAIATWNEELRAKRLLPFLQLFVSGRYYNIGDQFKAFMVRDVTVGDYLDLLQSQLVSMEGNISQLAETLNLFHAWMAQLNLYKLCEEMLSRENFSNDRAYEVLILRSTGKTLEEIAKQYCMTREWARQIENKEMRKLNMRLNALSVDIFGLIYAYRNGDGVLRKEEIEQAIGIEYANILWYYASKSPKKDDHSGRLSRIARYDSIHNVILVFEGGLRPNKTGEEKPTTSEIIDQMPDFIETAQLHEILSARAKEYGIAKELLALAAEKEYKKAGIFSYKKRLTVIQMCEYVLKERFPNGYKILDETEGELFQKYLKELFGKKGNITTRAIDAKIDIFGIQIDRGKYIHRDYVHIDEGVVKEIFAYIEASPKTAITYSEIYTALEDRFAGTSITNRYAMKGAMKLFNSPYPSHRDYITKGIGDADVADEFNAFVASAGTVHKLEIFEEFPGWKDANIAFVSQRCPEVIVLGNGYYMHASKLKITDDERRKMKKYLDANIQDIPVSARVLQNAFMILFADFMIRNEIHDHGKLFGILQYLFSNDYHFSRPFISREDVGLISNKGVLMKHLEGMDVIQIDDLSEICTQNALNFGSLSSLINSVSPEFLRVDRVSLMRYEHIGLREDMFEEIIEAVEEEIAAHGGYVAACEINDYSWYPQLNIPWTPFLLESVAGLVPEGIHTIANQAKSSNEPRAIFVCEDYADDDWNAFLVTVLKKEHDMEPFRSRKEILQWLQSKEVCGTKYPAFLDEERHVYFDENDMLQIE